MPLGWRPAGFHCELNVAATPAWTMFEPCDCHRAAPHAINNPVTVGRVATCRRAAGMGNWHIAGLRLAI